MVRHIMHQKIHSNPHVTLLTLHFLQPAETIKLVFYDLFCKMELDLISKDAMSAFIQYYIYVDNFIFSPSLAEKEYNYTSFLGLQ